MRGLRVVARRRARQRDERRRPQSALHVCKRSDEWLASKASRPSPTLAMAMPLLVWQAMSRTTSGGDAYSKVSRRSGSWRGVVCGVTLAVQRPSRRRQCCTHCLPLCFASGLPFCALAGDGDLSDGYRLHHHPGTCAPQPISLSMLPVCAPPVARTRLGRPVACTSRAIPSSTRVTHAASARAHTCTLFVQAKGKDGNTFINQPTEVAPRPPALQEQADHPQLNALARRRLLNRTGFFPLLWSDAFVWLRRRSPHTR